jgi:hypothetical protein
VRPKIFDTEPGDGSLSDALSTIALILGLMDAVGWLALSVMSMMAQEDPALKGIGIRLIWLIAAMFLVTAAPGTALAYSGRAPRLSLIFTGAFPVMFMLIYAAISIAFS